MAKERSESPPAILTETNKIIEKLESSEYGIFEQKKLLEQKQAYYEQLQQHKNDIDNSVALKRAHLKVLNNSVSRVHIHNLKFRNEAKQVMETCNEVYKDINDIECSFGECEGKIENIGKTLSSDSALYGKKIDELNKLLDQLTEKRKKELESVEREERALREETFDIGNQISVFEAMSVSLVNGDTNDEDAKLEVLDNEVKELQSKLNILNIETFSLDQELKEYEVAKEELEQRYDESKFLELENRFDEVNRENSQISQDLSAQKVTESELSNTLLTLEDYERKLNEEFQQKSKFFDDFDQNQYGGFSKIEQEISKIKADIIERNEKYTEIKNSGLKCIEHIKENDDTIAATNSLIGQLSLELREVENVFDNIKTSDYFSQQYNSMLKEIGELAEEKEKLTEIASDAEKEIDKKITQFNQDKDKSDLELLAIDNNHLMEGKQFEKDSAEAEAAKTNLEQKANSAENEIKELEETINVLKARKLRIEINQKDTDKAIEEAQKTLKIFAFKREELKKKLGTITAPSPIYVKETGQNFAMPKAAEMNKKKAPQKPSVVDKRNWDSDSSMEAEEVKLSDFLRKKYKKRQDSGN